MRWFRESGDVRTVAQASCQAAMYHTECEQISISRARGCALRVIIRRLDRAQSTISEGIFVDHRVLRTDSGRGRTGLPWTSLAILFSRRMPNGFRCGRRTARAAMFQRMFGDGSTGASYRFRSTGAHLSIGNHGYPIRRPRNESCLGHGSCSEWRP
jgi:hypothetical protein